MGRRRGRTGPGGAVVSSASTAKGGVLRGGGIDVRKDEKVGGGAAEGGWIGKTPVDLLREWTLRNKRLKARYDRVKRTAQPPTAEGDGGAAAAEPPAEERFKCIIPAGRHGELRGSNKGPPAVFGIGVGEQGAALAVLAQVEAGKPLQRILPPSFREQWLSLDKQREERLDRERRATQTAERRKETKGKALHRPVEVALSMDSRLAIEDALMAGESQRKLDPSQRGLANAVVAAQEKGDGSAGRTEDNETCRRLVSLGFARSDVQVALVAADNGRSFDDALNWLCFNLDESELPKQFAPKADTEFVPHGETVSGDVARGLAERLATGRLNAERELRRSGGDVARAAAALFRAVVQLDPRRDDNPFSTTDGGGARKPSNAELREEEVEALQAIYGHDCVHAGIGACGGVFSSLYCVRVELLSSNVFGAAPVRVVFVDASGHYPHALPVVCVESSASAGGGDGTGAMKAPLRRAAMRAVFAVMQQQRRAQSRDTPVSVMHDVVAYLLHSSHKEIMTASLRAMSVSDADAHVQSANADADVELSLPLVISTPRAVPSDRRASKELRGTERKRRCAVQPDASVKEKRQSLPAWQHREEAARLVRESSVVVVSGSTGSGKTTQVPQFVLDDLRLRDEDDHVFMLCTQPRRIAAITVAQRVAKERGQRLGDEIGYQVKMDSKLSKNTKLAFVTTGILLRRMQGDPDLSSVTHVLVDEVHERSTDTDVVLLLLRELLQRRQDLHVVLMSATVNEQRFANYFDRPHGAAAANPPPILRIEGRAFPVEERYLEDVIGMTGYRLGEGDRYAKSAPNKRSSRWPPAATGQDGEGAEGREAEHTRLRGQCAGNDDLPRFEDAESRTVRLYDEATVNLDLLEELVVAIDHRGEADDRGEKGAVLIFLPGVADIMELVRRLSRDKYADVLWPVALHASLSAAQHALALQRAPPSKSGTSRRPRKIVCSTNVAETSLTVEDVRYVVDSMRVKQSGFDPLNNATSLDEGFVSKASATQRRGRAGRVARGMCYRLVRRCMYEQLRNDEQPELRRCSLDRVCLNVLATTGRHPRELLCTALDPPSADAVDNSLRSLLDIGALVRDDNEETAVRSARQHAASDDLSRVALTPLGSHLATIPADVRIGKLLVYASVLGCTSVALSVAAIMADSSALRVSVEARRAFAWGKSDLLAMARVFDAWNSSGSVRDERTFREKWALSARALLSVRDARQRLAQALEDVGFDVGANDNAASLRVVKTALCAALYPNVARVHAPAVKYHATQGGAVADEKLTQPKENQLRVRGGNRVFLFPSSVNFDESRFESGWLAFHEKILRGVGKERKLMLRDSTMVSPYALLLFGGDIRVQHERGSLLVDGWMEFNAPARVGVLVKKIREQLDALLLRKISAPELDISKQPVLTAILDLLQQA